MLQAQHPTVELVNLRQQRTSLRTQLGRVRVRLDLDHHEDGSEL
jgi:hypothetical protein